ncbi:hypothetical protein C1H46_020579 [Malus baccata]|uniref:Uncharacterized protein n=1 Tax=Malus baccata TaxID=106549 RepID=A0A540M4X6_MALBA|nr:hypothetical protein C1H46_020579 [Malus baccata]
MKELMRKFLARCVHGNKFEAQTTTVGESNINCIRRENSCSCETEHPDEAFSSKKVELPCGHDRANVFVREDTELCEALNFEQIIVEEDTSEGFERNSKLEDGVLDKIDGQVIEDKHEAFVESSGNASGNIKEKHGHDLSGCDRTNLIALEESVTDKDGSDSKTEDCKAFAKSSENASANIKEKYGHGLSGCDIINPIALEESVMDKVGSDSKTKDSAGEHIQSFSSCELHHVMSKESGSLSDSDLANIKNEKKCQGQGPSNVDKGTTSRKNIEGLLDFQKDNGPERRDLPMQEGENFGIEESVYADFPVIISSHGLELNIASPMFTSIEMKELFRDDKIYGIVELDSEMSKVISMFEDSEDIYEGKEIVVGTLQVVEGQHGDHEHKLGEVAEQKPIQEMDIHYDAGFSIPHFSRCEQRNNHEQRMVEEVPKSIYTLVSDENTYANSALKKDNDPKWMSTPIQEGDKSGIEVTFYAYSPIIGSSHEDEALELNVALPIFTSFEMKEFFHDDNIYDIFKSNPEMSNVNSSMIEDGKESDVGTQQVAPGKHSYHEHEVEEVEELKSVFSKLWQNSLLTGSLQIGKLLLLDVNVNISSNVLS